MNLFTRMMAATVIAASGYDALAASLSVVPKPLEMRIEESAEPFRLSRKTAVVAEGRGDVAAAAMMQQLLNDAAGILPDGSENTIRFVLDPKCGTGPEGYELQVAADQITIRSVTEQGLLYGMQTLRQLMDPQLSYGSLAGVRPDDEWKFKEFSQGVYPTKDMAVDFTVPAMEIADSPRFRWRGMMLDTARHYRSVDEIKKFLDVMAAHKLNVFQWHLVDDEAWRIEVPGYPILKEEGGKGSASGSCYGFYSDDDVRDVVAYAGALGITVVPELDVPGHSGMVTRLLKLNCNDGSNVYCVSKEETWRFLEAAYAHVATLFPGAYVHCGGDECDYNAWMNCPDCTAYRNEHHLADGAALQHEVTKKVTAILAKNGKKAIGWDEILEGGVPEGCAVMAWRSPEAGAKAAAAGYETIMTPKQYVYLDYYQSITLPEPLTIGRDLPMRTVYEFPVLPPELPPGAEKSILGGQANLWSEFVYDSNRLSYMLLPRMAAVSEKLWSTENAADYADFSSRMLEMFVRYDAMKSPARLPRVDFERRGEDGNTIFLRPEIDAGTIYYTLDGSEPTTKSLRGTTETLVKLEKGQTLRARLEGARGVLFPVSEKTFGEVPGNWTLTSSMVPAANHPLAFAADGDEVTFFQSAEAVKNGDTLTVTFEQPVTAKSIVVNTGIGRNWTVTQRMKPGVLEFSTDGKEFHKAADFESDGTAVKVFEELRPLRAIRLRATGDGDALIVRNILVKE